MKPYSFSIIWSEEDNAYVATVPEFKNLSGFGGTREEALKQGQVALEGYLESARESDVELPEPEKLSDYSGQLRVRMPRNLHRELALSAHRNNVSLNTYMIHLLSANHAHSEMSAKRHE